MLIVPLKAEKSQTVTATLGGQVVQIDIYQKAFGLFANVFVSNVLVIGGTICQNLNRLVRSTYLGFIGDLMFIDNQGTSDPTYDGLGTRYSLMYLDASDLTA